MLELGLDELLIQVMQCSRSAKTGGPALRLPHSSPEVLSQQNQTLLFLPFFKEMRRPCHLTSYNNDDLGVLSGSGQTYQYTTIDRHLRELTRLRLSGPMGRELAQCYWQHWYQSGRWAEQHVFYLDAHEKVLWTRQRSPVGFVSAAHEVRACLKQFYLHGSGGHVLYCETLPCDAHLSQHVVGILERFEAAIGRPAVHVIVVDREGLSAEILLTLFAAKKAMVTLLRSDQYKSESDFERRSAFRLLKDARTGVVTHRVADADFPLADDLRVRCGLVYPLDHPERLIVVVTTVNRHRAPDIRVPVTWYLNRWEVQENSFRALQAFVHLNVNFGVKAKHAVPDRHVAAQRTQLTQHLQAVEHKLLRKQEQHTEERDQMDRLLARSARKLRAPQRRQAGQGITPQAQLVDEQQRHAARLAKHLVHQQHLEEAITAHQAERARVLEKLAHLDPQAMFFEVDAEKDQLMTHLRIAAYNAALFTREQYFGRAYQHIRPATLWRRFLSQDGSYRETDDRLLISLKPFRDPELHRAAQEACARFNERHIRLRSGKWLQITVTNSQ